MHSPSPIQSPRFGRTAAIAAAILASVAVFQLGAVTVAFCKKSPRSLAENGDDFPHPPPLKIDVSKIVADSPPPENPGALLVDPLLPTREERSPGPRPLLPHAEPLPLPPEATTEPPGSPPPRPTPVPLSVFTPKPDPRYGELVEQGAHAQLLEAGGLYARLWLRQQAEDAAAAPRDGTQPLPLRHSAA